jgi:hypothetical protein
MSLPIPIGQYHGYCALGPTIGRGQSLIGPQTGFVLVSDGVNLFPSKLGVSVPSFCNHITVIDQPVSKEKALWTAAKSIIALVKHACFFWNRTKVDHPACSVSENMSAVTRTACNPAITCICGAYPTPTSFRVEDYLDPKAFQKRLGKSLFNEVGLRKFCWHTIKFGLIVLSRLRTVIRRAATLFIKPKFREDFNH